MRTLLSFALLCLAAAPAPAEMEWLSSAEELCAHETEAVQRLFAALELDAFDSPPLEDAVAREDWPAACNQVLAHYRERFAGLDAPAPDDKRKAPPAAAALLEDRFTFYTVSDTVPRTGAGGLDWTHRGPNDDREWAWGLNRHYHISTLFGAYRKTGQARFVEAIDAHLQDWVRNSPYPGAQSSTAQWRGLEAALRMGSWVRVFTRLLHHPDFSNATALLMLSSLPDHAHYLRHFHAGGNWLTMEMTGLASIAVTWPEFREADAWMTYATEQMLDELDAQIYPDGVQFELTTHYHRVVARKYLEFLKLLREAGAEAPAELAKGVERLWNYLAYNMRPDGHAPLNNDSDLDYNRERILGFAARFDRPDWAYIASNGQQGVSPEEGPCVFFPWAGQAIFRSGWDVGAHWSFFDIGPLGAGHLHYDKLHLSVSGHGRDLLVDSGRFTYRSTPFRAYAISSAAHNVILVDEKGQRPYAKLAKEPLRDNFRTTEDFAFARGASTEGFLGAAGDIVHTRSVLYVRDRFWVVADRITTDAPRHITVLWHFHPDCSVHLDGEQACTTDADVGNLRILPLASFPWDVEKVAGRTEPSIQGWYSVRYNKREPNPTVLYSADIPGSVVFAWLMLPAKGEVPTAVGSIEVSESLDVAAITLNTPEEHRLTIPFDTLDAMVERPDL